MTSIAQLTLRVSDNIAAARTSRILRVDLDGAAFSYLPGQAVLLGIPGEPKRSPYSIACAPEQARETGMLEFLIKTPVLPQKGVSLSSLKCGDTVHVQGPLGGVQPLPGTSERRFVFIAGGTGIAPLRAVLQHVLMTRAEADVHVLYSARTADDFAYEAEFSGLARDRAIQLRLLITREPGCSPNRAQGRVDRDVLLPLVLHPETVCYICGPPRFSTDVRQLLAALSVPPERVRHEAWGCAEPLIAAVNIATTAARVPVAHSNSRRDPARCAS